MSAIIYNKDSVSRVNQGQAGPVAALGQALGQIAGTFIGRINSQPKENLVKTTEAPDKPNYGRDIVVIDGREIPVKPGK